MKWLKYVLEQFHQNGWSLGDRLRVNHHLAGIQNSRSIFEFPQILDLKIVHLVKRPYYFEKAFKR